MALERTFPCTSDTWVVDSGTGAGNGRGSYLTVGAIDGNKSRSVMAFDADYSTARSVIKAELRMTARDPYGAQGGNVQFWVEEVTENWPEGTYANDNGWSITNDTVWPGPSSTTARRVRFTPASGPASGVRIRVDVTDIVANHFAVNPSKPLRLRLVASDAAGYDELNASHTVTFQSRHNASLRPVVEVVLDDNRPPTAPVVASPLTRSPGVAGEGPALINGLVLRVKGRRADLDSGDHVTGTDVQVYTENATDDDSGLITAGTLVTGLTGAGQKTSYTGQPIDFEHVVTGFAPGQRVRYRARTRDRRNAWGINTGTTHGWTRLANGWVDLNTPPSKPTNLQADPTSPTPDYVGRHVDPDAGSSVSAVETQVAKDTPIGVEMIQNSTAFQAGDEALDTTPYSTRNGSGAQTVAGGTAWSVTHSGRALQPGERVRRRHRTVDQFGRAGAFSDWLSWDIVLATVPRPIPAAGVRQGTLAPTIGATHTALFDRMQLRGYTAAEGGTLILDTGEVTVSPAALTDSDPWGTNGTASDLQYGQVVWIERRVRTASTLAWTDFAPRLAMPIASAPRKPTVSVNGAVLRSDGTYVIGTRTPSVHVEYRSPDLPDDAPGRRTLTFRPEAGGTAIYTDDDTTTPALVEDIDIPAATLAWETTYQLTVAHENDVGVPGPDSDVILLKVHQPPTIVTGTAPAAADPTPTLTWTTTFYGSSVADHTDVWVDAKDAGGEWAEIHRETIAGDPETYTVPSDVLPDLTQVRATVRAYGTDGLYAELAEETDLAAAVTFTLGAVVLSAAASVAPAEDTFTGPVADGWGTATIGGAWTTVDAPAADYDKTATEGTLRLATAGSTRRARLAAVATLDVTGTLRIKTDKLAVGGVHQIGIELRQQGASGEYLLFAQLGTTQTVTAVIAKNVGGSTTLAQATSPGVVHAAGTYLRIKVQVVGANPTTLRVRIWPDGGGEPGTWDVEVTDSTAVLQAAGAIGIRVWCQATSTNAPILVTVDDLVTTSP